MLAHIATAVIVLLNLAFALLFIFLDMLRWLAKVDVTHCALCGSDNITNDTHGGVHCKGCGRGY